MYNSDKMVRVIEGGGKLFTDFTIPMHGRGWAKTYKLHYEVIEPVMLLKGKTYWLTTKDLGKGIAGLTFYDNSALTSRVDGSLAKTPEVLFDEFKNSEIPYEDYPLFLTHRNPLIRDYVLKRLEEGK